MVSFLFLSFQILGETDTNYCVQYVDYGDEWDTEILNILINRNNIAEIVKEDIPLEARIEMIKSKLALLIKEHLTFHRSHDPVVILQLDCEKQVFDAIF